MRYLPSRNSRPVRLDDVLAESLASDGVGGMTSRYTELYEEHYGGWAYDFSEGTLLRIAGRFAEAGSLEAAMAAIDRNLEVYPESFQSHGTRGQILAGAGDAEGAFAACLEVDATVDFCQQQIDELNAPEQQ